MKNNRSSKLVIIGRTISSGARNLMRSFWLASAATAVLMVTLTILLLAWVSNMALDETVKARTDDFSVGLYFVDDVDPALLSDFRKEIESKPYVAKVNYISQEEAEQIFIERGEEDKDAEGTNPIAAGIEVVGGQVAPASFDVRFNDLTKVDEILALAESDKYAVIIYDTSDSQLTRNSINKYIGLQNGLKKATAISIVTFSAIAILIVFNTIRMAVFSRSDEIEIMKLIGATPNYIRGPFLVEAMLYGIFAAILAFSITYSIMSSVLPNISGLQSEQTISYFSGNWPLVLGATIAAGMLIGLFSSLLATEKYLKLKRW